jgi:hypothetical protein
LSNTSGRLNTNIGSLAGSNNVTGQYNVFIGANAGEFIADGVTDLTTINNSVFLGRDTKALGNNEINQIVIGHDAIGAGSNTATLGNTSITKTILRGNVLIGTTTDAGHKLLVSGSGASGSVNLDNTLYVSGSRVGIGTSTPSVPIHGLINNENIVAKFEATGTGEGNIEMSGLAPQLRATTTNGTSGFRISVFGSTTGDVFRLQDSSTTLINVKKTGNVLINTTTDAGFKLDVQGTARVSGDFSLVLGNAIRFGSSLGLIKTLQQMLIYGGTGAGNAGGTDVHYWNGSTHVAGLRLNNNANVLINTTTDVASAVLNVDSTTKGFLPPRMTTTQRNAIASPAEGLMVYDTVLKRPCFYDGTSWVTL